MWQAILLMGAGFLASASFIVKKKPNAKTLLNILAPFQGLIGIAALVGGVLMIFKTLVMRIKIISDIGGFWRFVYFGSIFFSILLGALLGYGLLTSIFFRSEEKKMKAEKIRNGLIKVQTPLGILSLALGALLLIMSFTMPAVFRG